MSRDSSSVAATVRADASVHEDINNYTEIAHSIFGQSVGNCYGSFSCNLTRQHGRLYVASRAIMFYSNLFGFERRLCLPLSDVIDVKIYRSTSIFIAMFDGEEFIFKSFSHRERVVVLIKKLIAAARAPETLFEESEISETAKLTETTAARAPETLLVESEISETTKLTETANESGNHDCKEDKGIDSAGVDDEGTGTLPRTRSQSNDSMAQSCPTTIVIDQVQSVDDKLKAELPNIRTQSNDDMAQLFSGGPKRKSSTGDLTEDLFEEWKKVSVSKQKDEETLVDGVMLNCSLSTFFDLFLSDDAIHSLNSFHERVIGDTDIELTKWTNDQSGIMSRAFSFRHPLSNKLGIGPSSTLVTQKQNLERYGNFGICMETTTNIKGVPSSDTFYVSAKWVVESDNDNVNVSLKVLNKVVFTKRSLFKRAILSSSREEAKSFYDRYVAMIISHVQGTSQEKLEELPNHELKSQNTSSVTAMIWFQVFILIVVPLILQNYLLRTQVQTLHNEVLILKQKQGEATELLKNILQRLSE